MAFYSKQDIENELSQVNVSSWTYGPMPVEDWPVDGPLQPPLIEVNTTHRGEIAERFGRYFKNERHFDFAPYNVGDQSDARRIYLIGSRQFLTLMPIAVGAVEVRKVKDFNVLQWVWLHPMERGTRRWATVWDALIQEHGELMVSQPVSPPMKAFLKKMDLLDKRIFVSS